MHCEHEIAPNLYWIGGDDKRLGVFEGHQPVPDGMSYNTYLLLDEKAVLLDTIDRAVEERFYSTLGHLLAGRELDYIVVNHAEPDHSATLAAVARRNPNARIVCTKTCKRLIDQFTAHEFTERIDTVGDGDSLDCGSRTLAFATAPMVHWPDVMVTYDVEDKILFSADAFGKYGALDGKLFDADYDFDRDIVPEARRYYANIVGKYGTQVLELLDKAETLDIGLIAPLHGPLVIDNIERYVEKYRLWASYEPEDRGVVIAYASVYGGTRDVAEKLAFKLSDLGVHDLALYDLSVTDATYVLGDAFRVSNIVLASVTYNAGLFPKMAELLEEMKAHNLRRRRFSFIQNGSWGPTSGKLMKAAVEGIPEAQVVGETFTIKSRMTAEQGAKLDALAQAIADSVLHPAEPLEVEVEQVAPLPAPIVGAVREAQAPTKATIVPGMAPGFVRPADAPEPDEAKLAADIEENIIQVWRCTFCGYQAEVPKGTDMSKFTCPVCMHVGEFMLVREKIMPAKR